MPLQLVTPPTAEPLSRAQAKLHCRIITADEDALVDGLIAAARAACETRTRNQLVAARWKYLLDSFPGSLEGAVSYVPWGKTFGVPANAIVLPLGPVLQVASITYLDMGGNTQTLTAGQSGDYIVESSGQVTRITPPFGKVWPANVMPQVGAVTVTFDAGHAAPISAVDTGNDTLTVPGWKTLAVNDTLRVSNRDELGAGDGALPSPLASLTGYYVQGVAAADTYRVSASAGGAAIHLSAAGTGKSFIGEVPAALRSWMLLAVGSLYENRESVSVDMRITQVELPEDFRDGLLDPYRIVLY